MDFLKKLLNHFGIVKDSKMALECVLNGIIKQCRFSLHFEVSLAKKSENSERWEN